MARVYKVQVRNAEDVDPSSWRTVAELGSAGSAVDEVLSPYARMSNGDLLRVLSPSGVERWICVFDSSSSKLRVVPKPPRKVAPSWSELWDERDDPLTMAAHCDGDVDARKVALALADCAELARGAVPRAIRQEVDDVIALCRSVVGLDAGAESEWMRRRILRKSMALFGGRSGRGQTQQGRHAVVAIGLAASAALAALADVGGAQALVWAAMDRQVGVDEGSVAGECALRTLLSCDDGTSVMRVWCWRSVSAYFRRHVQLSSLLCSKLGMKDPVPFRPRRVDNPGAAKGAVAAAAAAMKVGKKLPTARYVHVSLLDELPPAVKDGVRRASDIAGVPLSRVQILKIGTDAETVSLLRYPGFWDEAFPALAESWTVDLAAGRSKHATYRQGDGTPILHRKEAFISQDDPRVAGMAALTRRLEDLGLFEDTRRIGRKGTWESMLRDVGLKVSGNRVVSAGGGRG